jgi:hypothetical protein
MLGYNIQPQEFPTGTLNTTTFMDTNYHMPFKKNEINFFNKRHKSHNRQIGQIPSQKHNVKYNTSHETNRTLRHDKHASKDIDFTNYSYNRIVKEIDEIKRDDNVFHAYKHHSQTLQPVRV